MVALLDERLKIEQAIEDVKVPGERRGYLGLSQIGTECPRSLWYSFRFCSKTEHSARMIRLWNRGHREEPVIIADLEAAGVHVYSPQECRSMGYQTKLMSSGEEQIELVDGYGHILGHPDGFAVNIPDAPKTKHLLEFKTMKEGVTGTKKRQPTFFHKMKRDGLEETNPVYFAQVQTCMRVAKVDRCLFITVNKNNDKRYYERVSLDKGKADFWLQRGLDIILSETPPLRVKPYSNCLEYYRCNWCDNRDVCLEGAAPDRNCRTCHYCDMENDGKWSCGEKGDDRNPYWLDLEDQLKGCKDWRMLETLEGL